MEKLHKHDWRCPFCGGTALTFSATVVWDYVRQRWEVEDGDIGGDFCSECEKPIQAEMYYPDGGPDGATASSAGD